MRRILRFELFKKMHVPAVLSQAVSGTNFDFDKYGKSSSSDDDTMIFDLEKQEKLRLPDDYTASDISAVNAKTQKPSATFWKREHKVITHPVFASEEYQNVMRQVRDVSVQLTTDDKLDFVSMITDRNKWIDEQVKKGMSPDDALEKMRLLIRIRELDNNCKLNTAIDDFLDCPPRIK